MTDVPAQGEFGPSEEHHWTAAFTDAMGRWFEQWEHRNREYQGRAILHGEAAAKEWLEAQPPIKTPERKDAPPA